MRLKLADGRELPDPASRWQPEGVNRPSAVWFPSRYSWGDGQWRGVPREDLAIYELHVGTFTPEGTLEAIIPRLPQLAELGVTAVELMPVAQFSGERNWGYDGVHPYAVQNTYGGPRALQRLIDAAHQAGLAVFLDVVYNHFGPEGNYLDLFGPYCTDRYRTPWGKAVNFDGPESDAVRRFVIDNALMWVRDFHADGLRLDAVHAIYDFSARHILAELQEAVQAEAARQNRIVHVIAESDQNDVRLVRRPEQGGYGLDGQWSDDFHHSVHALLTGQRDGYYQDFGRPEQLAKALNDVFVYDGCYSPFRRRRHGSRVGDLDRRRFVVAIQNARPGGQSRAGRPPHNALAAGGAAAGRRSADAFALRAAAVHGRGIWRDAAVSVLLLVQRSGADRGGPARPAGGVRRLGVHVGRGDSRSAGPRDVPFGQARLAVVVGRSGGPAAIVCRSVGGPAAMAGTCAIGNTRPREWRL